MRYLIAIDVGIKNLGFCVYDFRSSRVVEWSNVTLVPSGRYIPAHNVQYVRDFVNTFDKYFNEVFHVVIERQIRCNMRIIEAVLHSMFYDRCTVINARSVKLHYGLSMKNYRLNKQRAIEWVNEFTDANPCVFADELVKRSFKVLKKQDDLADSLLLILYYLDTYSNLMTSEEEDWLFTNVGAQGG